MNNKADDLGKFVKRTEWLLFVLLLGMVAAYFTWSENVGITRIIKVVGRIGVVGGVYLVYRSIIAKGSIGTTRWANIYAPLLYAMYMGLGFISITWSTNKGYSLLQWFMDMESLFFAYFFMKSILLLQVYFKEYPVRIFNMIGNTGFVLIAVFLIGLIVSPDDFIRLTNGGEEARLGSYKMNPNELGMLCGVSIASYIFESRNAKNQLILWLKTAILAYGLFLTGSRSSMLGVLIIGMFYILQVSKPIVKWVFGAGFLIAIPVMVQTVWIRSNGGLEEVMSMTGRLPFWKALITEAFPQEPWFGFGFMRIYYTDTFQGANTYAGHMTHNTFLQVLLNLGIVGFTIVFFQYLFTIKGILSLPDKNYKLGLLGILIPITINSFTEFGIFGETNFGILFYQLLIMAIAMQPAKYLTRLEQLTLQKKRPDLQLQSSSLS